jgi:single-strand DNA-binding protein
MANLNKVMLIGRLTRDPEARTFSNGGKVVKFGFAVNNRRKNQQSGQWEDEPVFVDMEVFNRGENGRQADLVEQSLRKGHQVFIEGHLRFEQWTGQDGQKRSKLVVRVDNFQFLEPRSDGASGEGGSRYQRSAPAASRPAAPARSAPAPGGYDEPSSHDQEPPDSEPSGEDIPF